MGDETPTAILTKGQREYLQGEREPTQERTMRTRIRDRARTGLVVDAPLINNAVDEGQISAEKFADPADDGELGEGIRSMVAFLYRLGDAAGIDPEKLIEDGMNRARGERLERILEKIDSDPATTVSPDELQTLNDHGVLPDETHSELFKQWLGSGGNIDAGTVREAILRNE